MSRRGHAGTPIEEIKDKVIANLIQDFGGRIIGKYWREGKCPNCGNKTLWTTTAKPLLPRCDKEGSCTWSCSTRERYPDLFEFDSKKHQPTKEAPNATADAYLKKKRGFGELLTNSAMKTLRTAYTQGKYWNESGDRGTATVKFELAPNVFWEKFIDKVTLTNEDGSKTVRDTRVGSFEGYVWKPPGFNLKDGETCYLVEGIFDAIAWYLAGFKNVVAIISATHYPAKFIKDHQLKNIDWVWALDHDPAGIKGVNKHMAIMRKFRLDARCMMPTEKVSKTDWNDLYRDGKLTKSNLSNFSYYGTMITARTPDEAAIATWEHTEKDYFLFNHRRSMYLFSMDYEKYNKACALAEARTDDPDTRKLEAMKQSKSLTKHASCEVDFLYTQRNPVDNQLSYVFSAKFQDGRKYVGPIKAETAVDAASFRKSMANLAPGALIKGKPEPHEWLLDRWFRVMTHIETVAYAGYVKDQKAFVFPKWAMRDGLVTMPNVDEYISFPSGESIKSAYHDVEIEPNFKQNDYIGDWWQDIYTAWGVKGIAALGYFTASLMTTQIRDKQTSFTFLEIVGEAGTGKSTLIEFLWKLFGRKGGYEGFDPSASTTAFIGRSLASVSNIPTVFIEGDRDESKGSKKGAFDWESLKKLYGGKSPYNRAVATAGNETYAPPFNSTIIVAQNDPIDASEAVLTRLCHLFFKRDECTADTLKAARRLESLPIDKVSGYLVKCLENIGDMETKFFEIQERFEEYIRGQDDVKTIRLCATHAQLAACVGVLPMVTDIPAEIIKETQQYIVKQMAPERERAIKQDHPFVQQFFEVIDYIVMEKGSELNHSRSEEVQAYSLNGVYDLARDYNQNLPDINLLKRALRGSRRFIKANDQTSSRINQKNIRCWKFKAAQ